MKRVLYFSMFCLAIVACNTKNNDPSHLSLIEQENANVKESNNEVANLDFTNIIGDWEWVLTEDSAFGGKDTLHKHYQVFYSIKADGTMKEIEHRLIKITLKKVGEMQGDKESILADNDDAIFTGTWRLSNDTLYKEGILSRLKNGEYKQGQERPRQETNVKGFSIVKRITKDSLFVVGKDGGTIFFIRK